MGFSAVMGASILLGSLSLLWAQTPQETRLRFTSEELPNRTINQFLKRFGIDANKVDRGSRVGEINRISYRFLSDAPGVTVERQQVLEADPQKTTLSRPKPKPGVPWISEVLPARAGEKALAWADFDDDGSDELLVGWPLRIFKRDLAGKWTAVTGELPVRDAEKVVAADVNHDGMADIVAQQGKSATLLLNDSVRPWVRHIIASGFPDQTALPEDFTGNRQLDVISGDIENDHKIFLFKAPDWQPTLLISGIRLIQSAAMDVDGDGDLDFVGAQYHPGLVFWLERPNDSLHQPWKYHVIDDFKTGGIDGVHGLALGDMDGDGRPDLVAASGWKDGNFPDSIVWFRIPKNAREAQRWQRFVLANRDAPGFNHYPTTGDVNGDGRVDVASEAKTGPDGNWFAWWQHPASAPTEPWKKHIIAKNQFGATNILIADLNGDGKADFVGSRGHGKGVVWFEAPDWTPHEIDDILVGTHGLAVGDIDGDGDLDIATCGTDSGVLAWFENDGKGHFKMHRIHEDQSTYEVRLVDMNGDGALDILVAGQESQNVVWYENRLRKK